jgi:hypothetical protein
MVIIVRVVKKADDPTSPIRVSIGAAIAPPDSPHPGELMGYYCVYRGTKELAIAACEAALAGLKNLKVEPPIQPDEGKKYA